MSSASPSIFSLKQTFAHHQPEILARAPPRRVGRLVNDVAQIVQSTGIDRLAGRQPGFRAIGRPFQARVVKTEKSRL